MDNRTEIIGAWASECGEFVYTFNADGTGTYKMGEFTVGFTYKDNKTSFEIAYTGSTAPPIELNYSISGNVLNVIDSFGKDTLYIARETLDETEADGESSSSEITTACGQNDTAGEIFGEAQPVSGKKWEISEIMTADGEGNIVWRNIDEILSDPTVDSDEKSMYLSVYEFGDDGIVRALSPIPEGCTEEELDEAVKSGEIELCYGRIVVSKNQYREEKGELWYKTDTEGEFMGEEISPWVRLMFDGDKLCLMPFKLSILEEKQNGNI